MSAHSPVRKTCSSSGDPSRAQRRPNGGKPHSNGMKRASPGVGSVTAFAHDGEGIVMSSDRQARSMLPIPDRPAPGLTTYDAKDPDTSYPPIQPLLPPEGAPNVLVILHRRRRLRRVERVRRTVRDAECRASRWGRAEVQPVPHHCALRPDPAGSAHRPQPPLGRDGQHHGDGDLGAGQQFAAAEHEGAAGDDAEAQRLLHGPVRQVP